MPKQEVVDAIQALEDAEGRLTPRAVVEAARSKASPLHGCFEWDDKKAAAKHRLDTARRLIVSVEMSVKYGKIQIAAPLYVHDPDLPPKIAGYRNTLQVRREVDVAREALVAEMARVRAILKRARSIAIVLGQESDLDAVERQVSAFIGSLAPELAAA